MPLAPRMLPTCLARCAPALQAHYTTPHHPVSPNALPRPPLGAMQGGRPADTPASSLWGSTGAEKPGQGAPGGGHGHQKPADARWAGLNSDSKQLALIMALVLFKATLVALVWAAGR